MVCDVKLAPLRIPVVRRNDNTHLCLLPPDSRNLHLVCSTSQGWFLKTIQLDHITRTTTLAQWGRALKNRGEAKAFSRRFRSQTRNSCSTNPSGTNHRNVAGAADDRRSTGVVYSELSLIASHSEERVVLAIETSPYVKITNSLLPVNHTLASRMRR